MKPKISIKVGNGHAPVEIQKAEDNGLQTTNKTVVGAINELRDEIANLQNEGVGEKSVYNADTHYDFPSIGDINVVYKAQSENLLYQWDPDGLKYVVLCESTVDIGNVDVIHGGNAI